MIAIFCFYNSPEHKLSIFTSKQFRHCDLYLYDGEYWLYHSLGLQGMQSRVYPDNSAVNIISVIKNLPNITNLVATYIHDVHKMTWSPFCIRTCNEVCRYLSGIDIGLTYNPRHLHNKLLKYGDSRNYEILEKWTAKTIPIK